MRSLAAYWLWFAHLSRGGKTRAMIPLMISYAHEDREFALAVAGDLGKTFDVWIDKDRLIVGQSLNWEVNKALATCDYVVTIISPEYMRKHWTRKEFDAVVTRENLGKSVMIPVLKGVSEEQMVTEWPLFADRLRAIAENGVQTVATEIRRAVDMATRGERLQVERHPTPLAALGKRLDAKTTAEALLRSTEGVQLLTDDVDARLRQLEVILKASQTRNMQFTMTKDNPRDGPHSIRVSMPYGLSFRAGYVNKWDNYATKSILRYTIFKVTPGENEEPEQIEVGDFKPWFYDGAPGWYIDSDADKLPIVPENLFIMRITSAIEYETQNNS